MALMKLGGGEVYSAFRLAGMLAELKAALPAAAIGEVRVRSVYLIDAAEVLAPDVAEKVGTLLGAGRFEAPANPIFITPRKGTISPWSSKATDIFRNCGLTAVRRVEQGRCLTVLSASGRALAVTELEAVLGLLHDRMTEGVYAQVDDFFERMTPRPMRVVDVLGQGRAALERANVEMGLALSAADIAYLADVYAAIRRNPSDVELLMFGQVNSEHCRHKIFNAAWTIDGQAQAHSLFDMIRNTHARSPDGTLVAYADNSGVIEGCRTTWFEADPGGRRYGPTAAQVDIIMKVETHNHPTAISPFPGAATGVGGEIRDEGATGVGGRSKAGLSAFMVSNLRIPGHPMPWERELAAFPGRLATPLEIMRDGPIGNAHFGNEFGRPQLAGVFRTYEDMCAGRYRGFHKPIMVAGGMGNIKREHVAKQPIAIGSLVIQIGGPAMRIGIGGGAASSMATGSNAEALDFDSVQRDNAEMQRRCHEVIVSCIALGVQNPILSIHDIGAGGLSNGCPELVSETGGRFYLRRIHNEDLSMSPMEIWCCEAQERYVLAIAPERREDFLSICRRERCPVAVIGEATGDGHLSLEDAHFGNKPIDVDLGVILGKPPRLQRDVRREALLLLPLDTSGMGLAEAIERVLRLPAVARKNFLITITDRSVTGLVCRDQMVGPYQEPLADVAVTCASFDSYQGEAMAMGERVCVALISGPASGRMAVGEAITNIAAASIGSLGRVKLSGNWMCACEEPGEDARLYETVQAVGLEFCPALGVSIPVGKDSLFMRTVWRDAAGELHRQTAPLSLIVSAFAPVQDVRRTVTPDLKPGESSLYLLDLGGGRNRLGGSALAQVYNQTGDDCPDIEDPDTLRRFFAAIQQLVAEGLLLAYHDRSDGGLLVAVAEMAIGGRCGVALEVSPDADLLGALFAEELGAVVQVADVDRERFLAVLAGHGLTALVSVVGVPRGDGVVSISRGGASLWERDVAAINRLWSEVSYRMQSLRDNPACADEELAGWTDSRDPGLQFKLMFDPETAPRVSTARPPLAVLREQGVNGHVEMAAAFDRAGFAAVDVHMTDLLAGHVDLASFVGLVACGGFSYGDVLGAGSGWARSILYNPRMAEMFRLFFARPETFALGVCNGCQMMAQLRDLIPGAAHWPRFVRNRSEQFEARLVTVEVLETPSVLLAGMAGSRLGIPVAHGEGRAQFTDEAARQGAYDANLVVMRYVDNRGEPTERYPLNPNGSIGGLTGLTSQDGRATIMMPHPERAFRAVQLSYSPPGLFKGEAGPWLRLFQNARRFVD